MSMYPVYVLLPDYRKLAASLFFLLLFHLKSYALLVCPANQTIFTQPFACDAQLDFSSLVWSNSNPLVDTVFMPGPGYAFPIGNTQVTLSVTEVSGNMLACSFTVTVNMYVHTQLACADNVHVDLDSTCTKVITADEILVAQYGCSTLYEVGLNIPSGGFSTPIATVAHIGAPTSVKVTNTLNGYSCWGSIIVNSGTLPFSITCPDDTIVGCNHSLDPADVGTAIYESCLDSSKVSVTFLDNVTIPDCNSDNTLELLRTWKAQDIYNNVRQCQQHITARRGTLPEIVFPTDLNFSCTEIQNDSTLTAIGHAGEPLLFGETIGAGQCDMSVEYTDSIAVVCGASYDIFRKWTVVEWCEVDVVEFTQILHVSDTEAPQVSLADTIYISTNPICGLDAFFPAALIDDCSSTEVLVTTPWSTANTNGGYVAVNPLAGTHPGSYSFTDACGNSSLENVVLKVQSGIISDCPADTTITCDFYGGTIAPTLASGDSSIFEMLGVPSIYVNCQLTPTQVLDISVDSCGAGQIVRTMGNVETTDQCVQHIEVVHVSDFVVQFPADVLINCGENAWDGGEPVLSGVGCEHLLISYTDNTFNIVPDACYKTVRTWVVKNLCISGTVNSTVEIPESQLSNGDCDLDNDGDCDAHTYGSGADGYIVHKQTIKIIDIVEPIFVNGCTVPDMQTNSGECFGTVLLPIPEVQDCSDYTVSAEINIGGVWLQGVGPFYNVHVGTYPVRYHALDHCNNQTYCTTTVKMKDDVPPVAKCKPNFPIIYLPQSGSIEIYASDFDDGSFDNCGGALIISFSQDVDDFEKTITCDDLGQLNINIWITDVGGNQSSCTTFLIVEDIISTCEAAELIGFISTETDTPAVNFLVTTSLGDFHTDIDGRYYLGAFYTVPATEIIPFNDENPTNGVTTFDVVQIRKHILGNGQLDSPYKIIAADANHSNTVTTYDLVVITKVILGNAPNFQNNTSWRFVPEEYIFPNPTNPFLEDFPETIEISPSNPNFLQLDFIAIKVGDVNGSASPSFKGGSMEFRKPPNETQHRH